MVHLTSRYLDMKTHIQHISGLLMLSISACSLHGQADGPITDSGLLYSKETITKLRGISDSLNLKYRTCGIRKDFYSIPQSEGWNFSLYLPLKANLKRIFNDTLSWNSFILQYPATKYSIPETILRKKIDGKYTYYYNSWENGRLHELNVNHDAFAQNQNACWIYEHNKTAGKQDSIYVSGFYIARQPAAQKLPAYLSEMIQYSECLIDTNTEVYYKSAKTQIGYESKEIKPGMTMKQKQQLLEEKRSTIVYGFCSMDQRPKEHARDIAILSAETGQWEVFLRAHLNIMNDRFNRLSDGSYAKAERKTHIRELELMNIDLEKLILGSTLRVSNAAENHYYSNVQRAGRALTEAHNRDSIRNTVLRIIKDNQVDMHNRLVMYYQLINYCSWLTEQSEKTVNLELLKSAVLSFDSQVAQILLRNIEKMTD